MNEIPDAANDAAPPEPWILLTDLMRRLGKKPNPKQLRRWRVEGLLTPTRERVRLRARKIGGRWHTTESRWEAFLAAINGDDLVPPKPIEKLPSEKERERRAREVAAELDALGCFATPPQRRRRRQE